VKAAAEAQGDTPDAARHVIRAMRESVAAGDQHWFHALAQAIREWPLAEEDVGGRTYRYLVAGEAFDWLLLAERLCEELDGLAPPGEVEQLIFHGRLPEAVESEDLQQLLGAKYRAHLNFIYGVRVEAALQLAVQAEVQKEHLSAIWENGHGDDEAFKRIYGDARSEMLARYQTELALPASDSITLHDLAEFTYWLFRTRVQNSDPARVASDTRKGLAHYQRLEALRRSVKPAETD
jgi:hypothetical protein